MASAAQPATNKTSTPFGGAPTEGNRQSMVGTASWFQTQDATPTTALVSPVSATTGTVIPLVVPLNAYAVLITPKTNPVAVSEIVGTTSLSQYCEVPAGTTQRFEVSRQNNVYLLGVTGTSVVSFQFLTL